MVTLDSQSTGHSASSRKYHLDENDTKDIIVYRMRSGYEITTQKKLCQELDKAKDPSLRLSRKPIPRGNSRVTVTNGDLFPSHLRSKYKRLPNFTSRLASVGLPSNVYWRRLFMNHFAELYIVSPEGSPNSSLDGSDGSKETTPRSTFRVDGQEDDSPDSSQELNGTTEVKHVDNPGDGA